MFDCVKRMTAVRALLLYYLFGIFFIILMVIIKTKRMNKTRLIFYSHKHCIWVLHNEPIFISIVYSKLFNRENGVEYKHSEQDILQGVQTEGVCRCLVCHMSRKRVVLMDQWCYAGCVKRRACVVGN